MFCWVLFFLWWRCFVGFFDVVFLLLVYLVFMFWFMYLFLCLCGIELWFFLFVLFDFGCFLLRFLVGLCVVVVVGFGVLCVSLLVCGLVVYVLC